MSFEPDPDVSNRIKGRAANIAEIAIDLVDDAKQLSTDFVNTLNELRDICEPVDFMALIIEHLPADMQTTLRRSGLDMGGLIGMIDSLKEDGVPRPDIRARIVNKVVQEAHPDLAGGFRAGFGLGHQSPWVAQGTVPQPSTAIAVEVEPQRSARLGTLIDQLLAVDQNVVTEPVTGHRWLMCQLVLRSGFKAAGAIRKHEAGMLVWAVEGRGPEGPVQLDHYLDYEDIETLVIPRVAPKPSIITG